MNEESSFDSLDSLPSVAEPDFLNNTEDAFGTGTRATPNALSASTPASVPVASVLGTSNPVVRGWQNGLNALAQGRAVEAVSLLRDFLSKEPNSFEGHNFLGAALSQSGQHEEAIRVLQRATQLQSGNAPAFYNLGLAQLGADATDANGAAATSFARALQLNPAYDKARNALQKLSPAAVSAIDARTSSTQSAGSVDNRDATSWNSAPASALTASSVAASSVTPTAATTGSAVSAWSATSQPSAATSAATPGEIGNGIGFNSTLPPLGAMPLSAMPLSAMPLSAMSLGAMSLGAMSGTATVAPSTALTPGDIARAAVFGALAALVSALVWDKLTYYTHYQFSLLAIGIGFLVGIAVLAGARGKTGVPLQIIGALCAGVGILLGELLLFDDGLHDMLLRDTGISLGFWRILPIAMKEFPAYVFGGGISFISWLFLAVGVYEGWVIPGRKKA